jgi:hypothetical protein
MSTAVAHFDALLGLGREAGALTFLQISLRGVVVFVAALVIVRCGDRRFLSQKTAFDAVLGFILASMLARAVNGTAGILPHARRRLSARHAPPSIGVLVAPLTCIWAPDQRPQ